MRSPQHTPAPRLDGDAGVVDVVVVGAGIFGLTVAATLAGAGKDVVVVEADRVGAGATAHSSAKLTALQSPRYARLEREHGPDAAAGYARLSSEAVQALADRLGDVTDAQLTARTAVTWSAQESDRDQLTAEHDAARRAGLDVRWADPEETGLPLVVGLALDEQYQFDPLVHLRGLRDDLLAAGGHLYEGSRVTGVTLAGSPRTVTTNHGGTVRGHHVVLATGLPILDRGLWFARTEPKRSYVVAVATREQPLVMGLRISDGTRSSRDATLPDGTPVTIATGGEHRTGTPPNDGFGDLADWATATFGRGPTVARWSAQDWSSADGLPLAGPLVPGDATIMAAGGFDKWGLTSGTAAARVVTDRILGRDPGPVGALLDPARFPIRATVPSMAKANARVGWHMTAGWLRALAHDAPDPAEGHGVVRRDGVRPVAVANVDGTVHRCLAVCPHLGGIVAWNDVDGAWGCPLHGSRFAADGEVLSGPATRGLANLDD